MSLASVNGVMVTDNIAMSGWCLQSFLKLHGPWIIINKSNHFPTQGEVSEHH